MQMEKAPGTLHGVAGGGGQQRGRWVVPVPRQPNAHLIGGCNAVEFSRLRAQHRLLIPGQELRHERAKRRGTRAELARTPQA